jgi:RIO kinase 1
LPRAVFDDDLDYEIYEAFQPQDEDEEINPIQPFLDDGTVTEVIGEVKSGKEGTVYVCRAHHDLGIDLVAAKVFRSRRERTFRNQAVYREGVVILNGHNRRAVAKKTTWGRTFEEGSWKYHEYEMLKALAAIGADVPKPIKLSEQVLLMEYIGDMSGAAPKLRDVRLQPYEVRPIYDRVMANIESLLANNVVHGDLSPYNILYWNGSITIIDFPQAVDPRFNRNALTLLQRDLKNVCQYFAKYGIRTDPEALGRRLWRQFMRAEL